MDRNVKSSVVATKNIRMNPINQKDLDLQFSVTILMIRWADWVDFLGKNMAGIQSFEFGDQNVKLKASPSLGNNFGRPYEAPVYGEAEGGENDESCLGVFAFFCSLYFQLPRLAHQTTVKALETGAGLSVAIRRIEEAFLQNMKCNCCKIIVSCSDSKSTLNMHHCCTLPRTEWTRGLVI
ncbi:hypothetical protein LWI29_021196 [Acer saccharum]|uniref:Uncharacterized protein n=1 Tax=Acer saccharum TaxID=4024 RepID=A0AA39W5Z1_ACESA|nr:hypothetical protein LWI29_021196 [Acer saccharum]